nr:MAG: DHA2 family efflux MFS transporter permease subunit [Hyphomicrobiales bacterium]
MATPPEESASETPENSESSTTRTEKVSLVVPLIIAASFFMEGLDTSIINTSLPQMAISLNATPPQMSAAITSYLLSLAIFIPISGWFADRFGAKHVYCAAIATFTLGSILCGFSTTLSMLIVSRIIQGIGGAMMTPVGRMILVRSFPKNQLMRAMTFNMLPANLGPTLGPLLGGYITTTFSWHWNFFINAPLGVLGIFLALRFFKNEKLANPSRFDWPGFVIIALGLVAAQLAIENLTQPSYDPNTQTLLVCAAVILLGSYAAYALRHKNPVVDLRMFRIRPFAIAVLVGNLSRMSVFPISFLVALLLQVGFGYSAFEAGQLTCWFTAGAFMMRANVANIVRAVGLRNLLVGCSMITATMSVGFIFFTPETSRIFIAAYLFVFGMLRNAQHQSVSALAYSDIPNEDVSKSTTIASLIQRGCQSFGVAMAASLLAVFAGGADIGVEAFKPVFIILALITASAMLGFLLLRPNDGWEISGHRINIKESKRDRD